MDIGAARADAERSVIAAGVVMVEAMRLSATCDEDRMAAVMAVARAEVRRLQA